MSDAGVVLVTGATGFIGSLLVRQLAAEGVRVRALVRQHASLPGAELALVSDLDDRAGVRRALAGAHAVVHLAARVHVGREAQRDALAAYRRVNVAGTRALLADAAAAGVQQFLFVSSVKAVGESNTAPWTAAVAPAPRSPYGVSKLEAEAVVRELGERHGLVTAILRLPLVYGPGQRANMQRLFRLVDRGIPLPLRGISNRRSLAYVGNVAAALSALLAGGERAHGTWYASDGEDLSTPELVTRIARALGRPVRLLPAPARLLRLGGRAGDVIGRVLPVPLTTAAVDRLFGSLVVDSEPLWRLRGSRPPYSVAHGLAETAAWYRQRQALPEPGLGARVHA